MKRRVVNILCISSIVAIFLLMFLEAMLDNEGPRVSFFLQWGIYILIPFAIPLIFGVFSLAFNKDKFKPEIWLTVFSLALVVYLVIALDFFGLGHMTKDLPSAIRKDYSQINGIVEVIESSGTKQSVLIDGRYFEIEKGFHAVEAGEEYTFYYLKNSRYVVDIIDEDGQSLLRDKTETVLVATE